MPGRLTIVETVHYESEGSPITTTSGSFEKVIANDEQPYQRFLKIKPEEISLNIGWADEWEGCGCIVIKHVKPDKTEAIPTAEQQTALDGVVVTVSTGSFKWLLSPGETMRGRPESLTFITLSSTVEAKVLVTILPR